MAVCIARVHRNRRLMLCLALTLAVVDASIHPDTQKPILLPFRMASFVPTNLIVTTGLLIPNATVAQTIFWQWTNQSINVAFNYCNANKTTPMTNAEMGGAYAAATATSCAVALSLKKVVQNSAKFSPVVASTIRLFIPYTAVALAGAVNVFLMRSKELRSGITVFDESGNEHGTSPAAGFRAVSQVAVSRMATALPSLTLPPLLLALINRYSNNLLERRPRLVLPVNLALISCVGLTTLPFAIALFPQRASVDAAQLEPEFRNKINPTTGQPVHQFIYNRGL
ncbi:sideroflexin, variant [Capsaspora owczarzaki ATCC 30864]|uniref:Sideroflexin, variant n=1 Tax=Capsaspora owczarzaki (strain ATCC 30864) TaxID=595528 RepID=A0A0D2X2W0_CAPO3|nr:sideroflexin, variant [Capsaspora owczarzaki ATCC 30864]